MASQQGTVDFILEQMAGAGLLSARRMFGEYAIYCNERVIAFVCDDQLFIKPTPAGRAHAGDVDEASPYPGGKPYLLIPGDRWEDGDFLSALARVTAAALPPPAPKRRKPR